MKRRLAPGHIVGRSAAIRRPLALAEQVAATNSTVLLLGETGTGKERFANYIHECSRRRNRLMVVVNCSAIPTPLLESELFGREKGAYTGALSRQVGRFELAHGSTLFLDEVGELPIEVQVKLLRVLENHTIERLGNPKPVSVDVRIIAATHRDLTAAVRDGRFREDLYYRLNVFPIVVPPLRERQDDIPSLVRTFVEELTRSMGKRFEEIDARSLDALADYAWPGNVRELRNAVERAMILSTGPILSIEVPLAIAPAGAARTTLGRAQIEQVLQETSWRIRGPHGAAARLGLKPTTLESRIRTLGLTRPARTSPSECGVKHESAQSSSAPSTSIRRVRTSPPRLRGFSAVVGFARASRAQSSQVLDVLGQRLHRPRRRRPRWRGMLMIRYAWCNSRSGSSRPRTE